MKGFSQEICFYLHIQAFFTLLFTVLYLIVYICPPSPGGDVFRDPQGMSETMDCTKRYIHAVFPIYTYYFSSAYWNRQPHYSCALGPSLSEIRVTLTCSTIPWQPVWVTDTWECVPRGDAGWRRGASRAGQSGVDGTRFHHAAQNGTRFKTYELCISEILNELFSDRGNWNHGKQSRGGGGLLHRLVTPIIRDATKISCALSVTYTLSSTEVSHVDVSFEFKNRPFVFRSKYLQRCSKQPSCSSSSLACGACTELGNRTNAHGSSTVICWGCCTLRAITQSCQPCCLMTGFLIILVDILSATSCLSEMA